MALLFAATSLPGQTAAAAANEDAPVELTVLVYNYAGAPSAVLAQAERVAGRILAEAGGKVAWVSCLDTTAERESEPSRVCRAGWGTHALCLRLLSRHAAMHVDDATVGYAVPPGLATVFYGDLARQGALDPELASLLGIVVTHEVGHLLLGPGHHALCGVMQPQWRQRQIIESMRGDVRFVGEQKRLLRAEVRRRQVITGREVQIAAMAAR